MKLRQLTIVLSLVGASTVGIVSCGGSSNNYPEISTVTGTAIDGYLSNAIICVDINRNSQCDQGEPSDSTDGSGGFSIETTNTSAPLVLESTANTVDITESEAIGAGLFMTAPNGSSTVTPLTTLAQIQSEISNISYAQAQTNVIADMGLTGLVTNLRNYDYISLRSSTDAAVQTAANKASATARSVSKTIINNVNRISSSTSTTNTTKNVRTLAVFDMFDDTGSGSTVLKNIADTVNAVIDGGGTPADVNVQQIADDNQISESEVEDDLNSINDSNQNDTPISTGGSGGTGGSS